MCRVRRIRPRDVGSVPVVRNSPTGCHRPNARRVRRSPRCSPTGALATTAHATTLSRCSCCDQRVPRIRFGDGILESMRARVLVVDDDPALAEMLGIVLRSEGFLPAFVADGERALAAFREVRPDIVLLDLMLPGMGGLDVCRAIRSESGVPIVMLTAKIDTVDVGPGLEASAADSV